LHLLEVGLKAGIKIWPSLALQPRTGAKGEAGYEDSLIGLL
jgi:hypothetical protein